MRKVGACNLLIVELYLHPAQFLMRQPQELIEHPQFMQQLPGGRMDGVAAKIAEEVPVLFKDYHLNAGAGQQQPKHHPGRAAADNTTRCMFRRHLSSYKPTYNGGCNQPNYKSQKAY